MAPEDHKHLILVGAGHSHLQVLEYLAKHPIPNLTTIVISQNTHIAYSGMIPGLIAGHYEWGECHIKLELICHRANAQIVIGEVNHLDVRNHLVSGPDIGEFSFDWLSLNIGSENQFKDIKGAQYQGISAKPIENLINGWHEINKKIDQHNNSYKIAIVGGGSASVELAFAAHHALQPKNRLTKIHPVKITLISASKTLLPRYHKIIGDQAKKLLRRRGIKLLLNSPAIDAHHYGVTLKNGDTISANSVIWATQAGSTNWLKETALESNEDGFICVNAYLQSCSNRHVFVAGDIAHLVDNPLPKSGAYAIRAGKTLAENIHSAITDKPLKPFRHKKYFLDLLTTGNKNALASWGNFSASGKWIWYWKDYLDRKFMRRFR